MNESRHTINTKWLASAALLAGSCALAVIALVIQNLEPVGCCNSGSHSRVLASLGILFYGTVWVLWLALGPRPTLQYLIFAALGAHLGLTIALIRGATLCVVCLTITVLCLALAVLWKPTLWRLSVTGCVGAVVSVITLLY